MLRYFSRPASPPRLDSRLQRESEINRMRDRAPMNRACQTSRPRFINCARRVITDSSLARINECTKDCGVKTKMKRRSRVVREIFCEKIRFCISFFIYSVCIYIRSILKSNVETAIETKTRRNLPCTFCG